jgi:hypothetical protein
MEAGFPKDLIDHRHHPFQMRPGCDFRYDSLESLVECFLGCDEGGDHAAIIEDGGGCGFIAGRFNRKDPVSLGFVHGHRIIRG